MDLATLTLDELQKGFRAKAFTPVDVLRTLELRIETTEPSVHAFLTRDFQEALKAAEHADVSLPLGGLPIGIKDAINVKGHPCTSASRILEGYLAPYDATVIARLKTAGAIPFGRLNMDEFAMGSSTENSSAHITTNPWDSSRIPGGSSGGSAAAVTSLELPAALGSDTGGSIRQPASLCGCVGLKPSYGRVSRYGLIAFASSLDQIGPLARSTRDCAMILNAIAGRDPMDSTSLDLPEEDFTARLDQDLKGVRLGIPKEYFVEGINPAVRATVESAIKKCSDAGAELVEISLPHTEYAVSVYYIIATAEASANLARFDGVRYGKRAENPKDLMDLYLRSREEGFGSEVKRRIILGTYVLSSGYHDAYYLRAQKVRTLIRRDFEAAFEKVDAIVCPTSPEVAFPIGERANDPLKMYLADIYTIAANLAEDRGAKLPVGLQFLAKSLDEAKLLGIANAYESVSGWKDIVSPI
jgi:aspartyl-tRNA(Asn)/glutamyl-tRNA(Gln) amidotransferase subunit A